MVTGGSRGLGKAIVLGLAAAGADVVVTSRKLEACQSVAEEVGAKTGRQAMAHACHVGYWEEIDRVVHAAYECFGRVDVLVNNAGMSPLYPDPLGVTEELYDKVLAVNLKGPFRLSARFGSRMVSDGGGSIVNISTQGSLRPSKDFIPYAAAKAELNAMTLGFPDMLAPRCASTRSCLDRSSPTRPREWATSPEFEARVVPAIPLQGVGQPEDIVGAVSYFASDASSYATGSLLRADGGLF